MHVPAGERKQTGRAKENNLYSQGKHLITYFMINYFTHEITEGLVLQSTLFHQSHDQPLTFSSLVV